jgi:hypothetical protein
MRAEYSESIGAFHCESVKVVCKLACSSAINKFPYRMVPSVNTLGFLIPDCNRVHGAVSGTGAEVNAVGTGIVESGINTEDYCSGRLDAARVVEDEAGPCPCAGTPKVVLGHGASAEAEVGAIYDAVGGVRCGIVGVGCAESPMIGVVRADGSTRGAG